MKILVTGVGAISSIGHTVNENLESLKKSKGGILQIEGLDNLRKSFVGGEIKLSKTLIKSADVNSYWANPNFADSAYSEQIMNCGLL